MKITETTLISESLSHINFITKKNKRNVCSHKISILSNRLKKINR